MTEQAAVRVAQALGLLENIEPGGDDFFAVAAGALALALDCRWVAVVQLPDGATATTLLAQHPAPDADDGIARALTNFGQDPPGRGDAADRYWLAAGAGSALAELGVVACRGGMFSDLDGRERGYLLALDDKPMLGEVMSDAFFALLCQRTGAEFDRRQARRAGSRSEQTTGAEQRFRLIADASPVAMVIARLSDGTILYANQACARTLDVAADRLVGVKMPDYYDAAARQDLLRRLDEEGEVQGFESVVRFRDGSDHWIRANAQKMAFLGEAALASAFVDITDRKQAEEALRESEQQYRALAEISPDAALVQVDGRIVFANQRACRMFAAATPEDLVGMDALLLVHPDEREFVLQRRRQAIETAEPVPYSESRHQRLDGTTFHSEVIAGPVVWQGRAGTMNVVHDITVRKQAELALRENESRFQDFANASADWFWELDADLRYIQISDNFARLTGVAPDGYFGRTREELLPVDHDRDLWAPHLQTLKQHQAFRDFVYAFRRDDGQVLWIRSSGVPVFDEDGGFRGYRCSATEIGEQMRAEAALRDSEERYRVLTEGSIQGIGILQDDRVVFTNDALARMLGYAAEDLIGREVAGLIAPDHRDLVARRRQDRQNGQQPPDHYEFEVLRRDGGHLWVDQLAQRTTWLGRPAVQVAIVDISDHKAAEAARRESELQFRAIAESSPVPLLITRRADGTILYANPKVGPTLGLPAGDLVGRNVRDFYWDPDERRDRTADLGDDGLVVDSALEMRRADGERISTLHSLQAITYQGEAAILGGFQDITDRLHLEEQLRQAQKMEVVGQLTGGVAHDFNNLLAVIMGNLELLERRLAGDGDLHGLVDSALAATRRGASLTHRLLAFSRKQPLVPQRVDLNRLVGDLHDLVLRTLGPAIEVETVIAGGLWQCEVDPAQLENAILNLAINARDAMASGGRLTIETANARLDDDYAAAEADVEPGQYVQLAVSDTGVGMPPDLIERAFEPFFTTKDVGKGSGLGLSMIYGFVRQSGGHVRIYSEPGEGTTVKIYLPRAGGDAPAADVGRRSLADTAGRGETIMLVEDDDAMRGVAVDMLRDLGYRMRQAGSGAAALALIGTADDIDLLITDVMLPGGIGGRQLADRARALRPGLRVLYMSGYTENAIVHQGRLDDGVELLEKPFRRADLAVKVRRLLDEPPPPDGP